MTRYLTSAQAAALLGYSRATFHSLMARLRRTKQLDLRAPVGAWPDARTPLWDAARLDEWNRGRPGR